VGILDTWVPIYLNGNGQSQEVDNINMEMDSFKPLKKASEEESSTSNTNAMGRVHILVSLPPFMSTTWGRLAQDFLIGPLFVASKQLLISAMLSSKHMRMAVHMTAVASLSGVQGVSSAMWKEGSSSLTQEDDPNQRGISDGNYVTL
jgi:hypothetical protein